MWCAVIPPKNSLRSSTGKTDRYGVAASKDVSVQEAKLINEEPLGREYGTHMLKGEYKGHSECHVGGDFLLIWYVEDDEITFVRTGNHADLFGK
jgi:mRNA interferase YafQ